MKLANQRANLAFNACNKRQNYSTSIRTDDMLRTSIDRSGISIYSTLTNLDGNHDIRYTAPLIIVTFIWVATWLSLFTFTSQSLKRLPFYTLHFTFESYPRTRWGFDLRDVGVLSTTHDGRD